MSFTDKINAEIKTAMLARNEAELRGLRAIKAALLLAATSSSAADGVSEEESLKILQKLAKQRKESIEIFQKQNREDLAQKEQEELSVIERFLPKQMSDEEIMTELSGLLQSNGISTAAEFGKAMPIAMKHFAGRADGKKISELLKKALG